MAGVLNKEKQISVDDQVKKLYKKIEDKKETEQFDDAIRVKYNCTYS